VDFFTSLRSLNELANAVLSRVGRKSYQVEKANKKQVADRRTKQQRSDE
jgi:hypothetical protein